MRLIIIGSSSSGNAYALDSGEEILLLEAGCRFKGVQKAIGYRAEQVVGCCITHVHGDHCKYSKEYAERGIRLYGCEDFVKEKQTEYKMEQCIEPEKTHRIGSFDVVPFHNFHDVEIYGYLIRHKDMGTMLFSTDSYKIGKAITGINHYLIEANYSDDILKENVWNGSVSKAQADRIMLSHMSLDYCVRYLRDCQVGCGNSATKTITLCHLSSRNADPNVFQIAVASAFGVPTYIAHKHVVVNLNKEEI